jgi:hypothetical protein
MAFLHKYEFFVIGTVILLMVAGIGLSFYWLKRKREPAGTPVATPGASKFSTILAPMKKFIVLGLELSVLVLLWLYAGPRWAVAGALLMVVLTAWFRGYRIISGVVVGLVVVALFGIGAWKFIASITSTPNKQQPANLSTDAQTEENPSSGDKGDAPDSGTAAQTSDGKGDTDGSAADKTPGAESGKGKSTTPASHDEKAPVGDQVNPPAPEISPVSEDRGSLKIRLEGPCSFSRPDPNEFECHGYFQLKSGAPQSVLLDNVTGKYGDKGSEKSDPRLPNIAFQANARNGEFDFEATPYNDAHAVLTTGTEGEFTFFVHIKPGTSANVTAFTLDFMLDNLVQHLVEFKNVPIGTN